MMHRVYKSELIDDFSITDERIVDALSELKVINRFLGGNSVTKKGFDILLRKCGSGNNLSILDAGIGGADNLTELAAGRFEGIKVFGIDLNKGICRKIKENYPFIKIIYGDMTAPPFRGKVFDIIHFSLVLHHFREDEIKKMLANYMELVNCGLLINDLQRSYAALIGIKLLTAVFSRSELVKNDAPLSVKRGFKKKELVGILEQAGFRNYYIKRKWAFRWMVVVYK